MLILRKIPALLLLLIATLALSVPAAASIAHEADHKPGTELHFHYFGDDDHGNSGQSDRHSDDQGVAHGHPPFSATDPLVMPTAVLPLHIAGEQLPQDWSVSELGTLSWTPQKRPPRA